MNTQYERSIVVFCKKSKVLEVSRRGPQKMGKEKAFGGAKAEDVCQRRGTSYYPKGAASPPARVSVLLEALQNGVLM
jgi:hypothetical protein